MSKFDSITSEQEIRTGNKSIPGFDSITADQEIRTDSKSIRLVSEFDSIAADQEIRTDGQVYTVGVRIGFFYSRSGDHK